jgi:hypothetical protein
LDVVSYLDVLEHLIDPWTTAKRLAALLKPGGVLVAKVLTCDTSSCRRSYFAGGGHIRLWLDGPHASSFLHQRLAVELGMQDCGSTPSDRPEWRRTHKRAMVALSLGALEPLFVFQYRCAAFAIGRAYASDPPATTPSDAAARDTTS